ncbi:MAG: prepilin-type N-terminal cleavage/methylation domain-containing protein [Candidatus Vogelbacteria bacterium]
MNLKPKSYQLSAIKGFTLIESLVAITILIIGVMGPMMAATRGITDGLYAQNQLIATHLTQEGLELASIQLKNNNPADFLDGFENCSVECAFENCSVECAVVIDPGDVSFSFDSCLSSNDCNITYDPTVGFYQYSNGTGPVFKRTLKVTDIDPDPVTNNQVLLEAKVTWVNKAGTAEKNVTLYRYAVNP